VKIINPRVFEEAIERFPHKETAITAMRTVLRGCQPTSSSELKRLFSSLEKFPGRPNCYRLDVGGRKGLRMICVIQIRKQSVFIHLLGNHKEYDEFRFR